jgi:hypothetical protein
MLVYAIFFVPLQLRNYVIFKEYGKEKSISSRLGAGV